MHKKSIRYAVCFFVLIVMFFASVLSVISINGKDYAKVSAVNNSRSVSLGKIRRNFFDCNLKKITGNDYEIKAVVTPTDRAITAISTVLTSNKEETLNKLQKGETVTVTVDSEINCEGIVCVTVPKHISSSNSAQHLIGYLDYEGNGISGLEKAYNDKLYTGKQISVRFAQNAKGEELYGIEPEVVYDTYEEQSGIMLTLDADIQAIAERASAKIQKGAVVISDVTNGEIKALVSKPYYNADNIAESLNDENNPFLNRALNGYNVGSAFKLCIAAAGIESSISESFVYNCTGKTEIGEHIFKCHLLEGHGEMDLKNAIKYSCNTFFYNFAIKIGGEKIYNTASKFGFGRSTEIAKGIYTNNEYFPSLESISGSDAVIANIAIGQGSLLASPVKMLNLYSAIANGGTYCKPSVVKGTVSHGILTETEKANDTIKAIDENTALILKKSLKGVIEEGTGIKAKPDIVSAAGKTATAENAENFDHSWFCGFFPYENPKYAVIVFCECAEERGESSLPIFREIADEITKIKSN